MVKCDSTNNLKLKRASCGISDLGLVRKNNEDVFAEMPEEGFYIIADGMGGHNAGEVAAQEAVGYITERIRTLIGYDDEPWEIDNLKRHLSLLIENANAWVHYLGRSTYDYTGMGTTICSALFHENILIHAHIGDSRIYRFRRGLLTQLTTDHTAERPHYRENPSNPPEMVLVGKKRVLTRALGTQVIVEPDLGVDTVESGDLFLLCSDGLTDLVANPKISYLLSSKEPLAAKGASLLREAKLAGGHDNITILLVEILSLD